MLEIYIYLYKLYIFTNKFKNYESLMTFSRIGDHGSADRRRSANHHFKTIVLNNKLLTANVIFQFRTLMRMLIETYTNSHSAVHD